MIKQEYLQSDLPTNQNLDIAFLEPASSLGQKKVFHLADRIPAQENQESGPSTFQQRQFYQNVGSSYSNYYFFKWEMPDDEIISKSANQVLKSIPELRTVLSLKDQQIFQTVLNQNQAPLL
ncbi:MAG: hypothetical protein M1365_16120, partial [Actinobacteria bacterium]|nr:hypothetical protein [Actinomycetota bacterium]